MGALLKLLMAFVLLIIGLKIIAKFTEPETIGEGFRGNQIGGEDCGCTD